MKNEQRLTDVVIQDPSHEMEVDNQDQVAAAVDQHPDSSAHQQQQQQQPLTPQEHRHIR